VVMGDRRVGDMVIGKGWCWERGGVVIQGEGMSGDGREEGRWYGVRGGFMENSLKGS